MIGTAFFMGAFEAIFKARPKASTKAVFNIIAYKPSAMLNTVRQAQYKLVLSSFESCTCNRPHGLFRGPAIAFV